MSDGTADGTMPLGKFGGPWFSLPGTGNRLLFFFPGLDFLHGSEPWVTDGTQEGTVLLKDMVPGNASSSPDHFTAVGDRIFFTVVVRDPEPHQDLWVSDGTADGTTPLMASNLDSRTAFGDRAFFLDGGHQEYGQALWTSDGTAAGTVVVKEFPPDLHPIWLVAAGQDLFARIDSPLGGQLWVSDGTPAGTKQLDVSIGSSAGVALGGRLYFQAPDALHGSELWVSDGSPEGTKLLKDLFPGADSSSPRQFTAAGDQLFFVADDPEHGAELWVSNGGAEGTKLVADLMPGSDGSGPGDLAGAANRLYFDAEDLEHGRGLFVSDGTTEGTHFLKSYTRPVGREVGRPFHWRTAARDRLFFAAADLEHGTELWMSDGTPEGTGLLKDLAPGTDQSGIEPAQLKAVGNRLFFGFLNRWQGGWQTWVSDGSREETKLLAQAVPGELEYVLPWAGFTPFADRLFFVAHDAEHGRELWVSSDETLEDTTLFKEIRPGPSGADPRDLTVLGDRLFFAAGDSNERGLELWVSDGTPAGTILLKDLEPGPGSSWPRAFTVAGDRFFFTAYDSTRGPALWVSDGTQDGTRPLKGTFPGGGAQWPTNLTAFGSLLVFAFSLQSVSESWISDGTVEGTRRLVFNGLGWPSFTAVGDRLFIGVNYPSGGALWLSDGTPQGTTLVRAFSEGASLRWGTALGDRLFFAVINPTEQREELWVSDGTPQGTAPLKGFVRQVDFPLGGLKVLGGRLFFNASDPEHGSEIWVSDGTEAGTVLFADVNPGPASSWPVEFTPIGNRLYFSAADEELGRQLWVVDLETEEPSRFHRGDPDSSGTTDISDGVAIFGYLFLGDPGTLACLESADTNDDATIDISDGIAVLEYLFLNGPPPAIPGPPGSPCGPGPDPPGSAGGPGVHGIRPMQVKKPH